MLHGCKNIWKEFRIVLNISSKSIKTLGFLLVGEAQAVSAGCLFKKRKSYLLSRITVSGGSTVGVTSK